MAKRDDEIITADSTPDLDEWGWDTFWLIEDWIYWHGLVKAKKGKKWADYEFAKAWNSQSMGANPLDARTFNANFRKWFKEEGLTDVIYSNAAIMKPAGTITDIVTDVTDGVSNLSSMTKWLIPILGVVAIGLTGLIIYRKMK